MLLRPSLNEGVTRLIYGSKFSYCENAQGKMAKSLR